MNFRYTYLINILSFICALAVLILLDNYIRETEFRPEEVALGGVTKSVIEYDEYQINNIDFSLNHDTVKYLVSSPKDIIISLGNSQSHSINNPVKGDRLFCYYLKKALPNVNFINLSGSSPSIQEYLVGFLDAKRRLGDKIKVLVVASIFDSMRFDGLRGEMKDMVKDNIKYLSSSDIGRKIIDENLDKMELKETPQSLKDKTEKYLVGFFERHFLVFKDRGKMAAFLSVRLYFVRNLVFGVKPSSIRNTIPIRYEKNFEAYSELFRIARASDIKILAYIIPIRVDVPIPYDRNEYNKFKSDLGRLVKVYDLDNIVPGEYWGLTNKDWIDYKHFKGEGHRILYHNLKAILESDYGL